MHWFLTVIPVVVSFALTSDAGFIAYKDAGCTKKLTIKSDGEVVPDSKLLSDRSLTDPDFAGGRYYHSMDWGDATLTGNDGAGAANVWFKPDPAQPGGCTYLLMRDNAQGWGYINPLPGQLVLRAPLEDCVYAPMIPGQGIISSYCCGAGDCRRVEVEYNGANQGKKREIQNSPLQPREISYPPRQESKAERGTLTPGSDENANKNENRNTRSIGSLDARAAASMAQEKRDIPENTLDCEVTQKDAPFYTSGLQRAVTSVMTCDDSCTHSDVRSTTTSTTVGSSTSHTFTWENGMSLSVEAGFNFLVDLKSTAQYQLSFAKAWEQSTSTETTTAKTHTTIQSQTQQGGTTAMMTFTPTHKCWQGSSNCTFTSDDKNFWFFMDDQVYCQPVVENGLLMGDYSLMYLNGA